MRGFAKGRAFLIIIDMVKSYNDDEILQRVIAVGGHVQKGTYLLVGVQSNEDAFNKFDDKFYLYDGGKFVLVTSGTTNAGKTALKLFDKYSLSGAAVWQTDKFYKGIFKRGFHKKKMRALRQVKPMYFFRDSDKDDQADQTGLLHNDIIYANFHGVSYDPKSNLIKNDIGGWSFACQVCNNMKDYRKIMSLCWDRNKPVDYCILKEW